MAGRGMGEIAYRLYISAHGVRDHMKSILDRHGLRGDWSAGCFNLHYKPLMRQIHL